MAFGIQTIDVLFVNRGFWRMLGMESSDLVLISDSIYDLIYDLINHLIYNLIYI